MVLTQVRRVLQKPSGQREISRYCSQLLKDADFLFSPNPPKSSKQRVLELNASSQSVQNKGLLHECGNVNKRNISHSSWTPVKDEFLKDHIKLPVNDGSTHHSFHTMLLRLNCRCSKCSEPSSGQKMFVPWNCNPNYKLPKTQSSSSAKTRPRFSSGSFDVTRCSQSEQDENLWNVEFLDRRDGSTHLGSVSKDFLAEVYHNCEKRQHISESKTPKPLTDAVRKIDYTHFYGTEEGLFGALTELVHSGMVILKNAPQRTETIQMCMARFGPVAETIYGIDWRVKVEDNPINIAYSNEHLDYHMDLIYYESAPGLQGLHAYLFDRETKGGESLLLDVFPVAEEFRRLHPDLFQTFSTVPATFQKIHFSRESPVYLRSHKPHIEVNRDGAIIAVNWSPQFEGPLLKARPDEVASYYEAYTTFGQMLQDSKLGKQFKLEENDVLVFNNRRIVHGRTEIESRSGGRELIGAYVNIDEFYKTYNVLAVKYGKQTYPVRVGNHDQA